MTTRRSDLARQIHEVETQLATERNVDRAACLSARLYELENCLAEQKAVAS